MPTKTAKSTSIAAPKTAAIDPSTAQTINRVVGPIVAITQELKSMTDATDKLQKYPANPGGYQQPPAGFEPHVSSGGFSNHNGPFYQQLDGKESYRGFYVLDRHTNGMGITHGGLLMTFADGLLGMTVFRHVRRPSVTVRMTTDFISSAKQGEWVEGKGRIVGETETEVYVSADIYVGDRTVMTAQGIFKPQYKR